MGLLTLPVIVIDRLVEVLVSSVSVREALVHRQVNTLFSDAINRCLFDLDFYDYKKNGANSALPPAVLGHIILGQARRRGRDNHLLTAVWDAVEYLDCSMAHSSILAVGICEAVARHKETANYISILRYQGTGGYVHDKYLKGAWANGWLEECPNVHSHRLSAAIIGGNSLQVRELLGPEALDVNTNNTYFGQPLHLAAAKGKVDIAKLLLESGADVRAMADKNDWLYPSKWRFTKRSYQRNAGTAIRIASLRGHLEMVQMLLKTEELLPLVTIHELEMCVHNAVFSRNADVVESLLSFANDRFPSKVPELREHIYLMAVQLMNLPLIKSMFDQGVDPNATLAVGSDPEYPRLDHTALYFARHRGRRALSLMRFLLENGADPNFEGKTYKEGWHRGPYQRRYPTIHWAIKRGKSEIVDLLLEYGASETALSDCSWHKSENFYDIAVKSGQHELAEKFLKLRKVSSSEPPELPLSTAGAC